MALHHAESGEVLDLRGRPDDLGTAQTTALVKTDSFEAIHLVVQAGGNIAAHQVAGRFTLQCLEGRVSLGLEGRSIELSAGQWVYFDGGIRHSLDAIEDTSLLLTIVFGAADQRGQRPE